MTASPAAFASHAGSLRILFASETFFGRDTGGLATSMAASSDLQALQLQIQNLQQKLDWKQLKINQLEQKVRDLLGRRCRQQRRN